MSELETPVSGWNKRKVDAFAEGFLEFLTKVKIDSKDKGGGYCLADGLYDAQNYFLSQVFDGLAVDIHDFKVLKSRQLGMSTICRALGVFWWGMFDGVQAAVIYDTASHTAGARLEIEGMIQNLPKGFAFPRIRQSNRDGLLLENGSRAQFMSAGVRQQRSAGVLGRSSGLNFIMGSEMCSWENDEGITSLKSSVSDMFPNRLYLWESTARGPNAWKEMWDEAKLDDLNQRTIFLGWYLKPTQKIAKGTPAYEKYGTPKATDREKARIAEVERRYGWRVTPEQLAWYRRRVDPAATSEDDSPEDPDALQDQPWTEDEAFQMSGSTFFSPDKLSEIINRKATPKFDAYKFWPGTNFTDSAITKATNKREVEVKVWEEPQTDAIYVVSGDVAFGHSDKNDRSAIEVLRCYADQVEQVAEYASATIQPHQFAWLIWTLVGWYGGKSGNTVTIIIELNGPGQAVWREIQSVRELVTKGYLRSDAEERGLLSIFRNVRQYLYSRSDALLPAFNYQWKTNQNLKITIMERLRDFTHQGILDIRSVDVVEEMRCITRDGDTIEAEGSAKDDRVMALAMACEAWDSRVRRALVAGNRTKEADIIARSKTPIAAYQLFTRNTLASFFKIKHQERMMAQRVAARDAWRRRG